MLSFIISEMRLLGLTSLYCCWIALVSSIFGFNLYYTDRSFIGDDHDCLYYHVPEYGLLSQVIPYCIRIQLNEEDSNYVNHHPSFTFEDLRNNNVTSFQLYTWSAPIDLIESYQSGLENSSSISTFRYFNCTYPWFGSHCEYSFDEPQPSFDEQVKINSEAWAEIGLSNGISSTCYIHLQCNRVVGHVKIPGACLDWREICDGKIDCIDSTVDEEQCWQLEINECDDDTEYRCHNGLCISVEFFHDDIYNADCLDRSDESFFGDTPLAGARTDLMDMCFTDPASRCEDHMCHPNVKRSFFEMENDGICNIGAHDVTETFFNRRSILLYDAFFIGLNASDACRKPFFCLFTADLVTIPPDDWYDSCDRDKHVLYAKQVNENCPTLIEFPPMVHGHIRPVYTNDQFLVSI